MGVMFVDVDAANDVAQTRRMAIGRKQRDNAF